MLDSLRCFGRSLFHPPSFGVLPKGSGELETIQAKLASARATSVATFNKL